MSQMSSCYCWTDIHITLLDLRHKLSDYSIVLGHISWRLSSNVSTIWTRNDLHPTFLSSHASISMITFLVLIPSKLTTLIHFILSSHIPNWQPQFISGGGGTQWLAITLHFWITMVSISPPSLFFLSIEHFWDQNDLCSHWSWLWNDL